MQQPNTPQKMTELIVERTGPWRSDATNQVFRPKTICVKDQAEMDEKLQNREGIYEPGDLFVIGDGHRYASDEEYALSLKTYIEYPHRRKLHVIDNMLRLPFWYTRYLARYRGIWQDNLLVWNSADVDPTDECMRSIFRHATYAKFHLFKIIVYPQRAGWQAEYSLYVMPHSSITWIPVEPRSTVGMQALDQQYAAALQDREVQQAIAVKYESTHDHSGTSQHWYPDMQGIVPSWKRERCDALNYKTYRGLAKFVQQAVQFIQDELPNGTAFYPMIRVSEPDMEFKWHRDDPDFNQELIPGYHRRWPYLHCWLRSVVPILMTVDLPPYVILEIIDWLPWFDWVKHITKIKHIESVHRSARSIRSSRSQKQTELKTQ